jgi:hypothetical protein
LRGDDSEDGRGHEPADPKSRRRKKIVLKVARAMCVKKVGVQKVAADRRKRKAAGASGAVAATTAAPAGEPTYKDVQKRTYSRAYHQYMTQHQVSSPTKCKLGARAAGQAASIQAAVAWAAARQ